MKKQNEENYWNVHDGLLPVKRSDGAFDLLSPMSFKIPPMSEFTIALGVYASKPVHVFQSRTRLLQGINLPDGIWAAIDSNTDIKLVLRNSTNEVVLLERGEVLARCAFLT